jgi:hypothetical protein
MERLSKIVIPMTEQVDFCEFPSRGNRPPWRGKSNLGVETADA